MGRSKMEGHTAKVLKAVKNDLGVPEPVFLPPALRGAQVAKYFSGQGPNIKENLVRIYEEADPVGYLIAIATGQPVATFHTYKQDGEWKTRVEYKSLDIDNPIRLRAIQHLADKVIPKLTQKTKRKADENNDVESEWTATLGGAAERYDDE